MFSCASLESEKYYRPSNHVSVFADTVDVPEKVVCLEDSTAALTTPTVTELLVGRVLGFLALGEPLACGRDRRGLTSKRALELQPGPRKYDIRFRATSKNTEYRDAVFVSRFDNAHTL